MIIYLRVLKESFNFAINALKNNKLRTFLSLLGVTIGIFSIIAVLASVDSLKSEIEDSISGLDNSTIFLCRFSFGPTDVPRWKWEQYPDVTYEEHMLLKKMMPNMKGISFQLNVQNESVKFEDKSIENVEMNGVTEQQTEIENMKIAHGRFFNESESNSGAAVIVIGDEIANSLFGSAEMAIGKKVRVYGRKLTVIGVMEKEGSGIFGGSKDTATFLPVNFMRKIFGDNNKSTFPFILIKPEQGVDNEEFIALLSSKMRIIRGIKAERENDFFVNQLQGFSDAIDSITGSMNVIGGIISLFSLLVGGFGIANIMFVSVKERTNLIGIQKSLGAKRRFILYQFLFEAMILAIIGGLIGLLLVLLGSIIATYVAEDFEFVLSLWNMFIGTAIAAAIGLISGILPAIKASKLDPVEAIRTGM
ncbi:ABC transporter permease [Aureisphaera sp. CAU 1614]|uniref:ABC transporter permease n=1 Tax=Halomarinibacterium sedimenti TaxID=2857106 RepID=A0A9X1JZ24_9FLAO|nr:ABC transporter permease [Halomarinibacterium sedimenti]MBW2936826.1 ABC transporter permease [Halomarinibacterium sedimenti]